MIIIVTALMYGSLSAAFSFALLRCMPPHTVPALRKPRGAEQLAVALVIVCSILSAVYTASEIAESFQVSLFDSILQVLYSTVQGYGVLGSLLFGSIWYGTDALVREGRIKPRLFLFAVVGLVVSIAASMHAATLSFAAFAAQVLHLAAVSAWLGTLLLAGWLAQPKADWSSFYRWYTPLAIGCVAAVTASGLLLMSEFSTKWISAWVLDYGQILLVKHLLIIPLLAIASVNALLIAPKAKGGSLDPRGWMRSESALSLVIFIVTAVLSRTVPPHDLEQTLRYTPPSNWFLFWYEGIVTPEIELTLAAEPTSGMIALMAVMFIGMIYLLYRRRGHPSLAFSASLLFVAFGYVALMLAVR